MTRQEVTEKKPKKRFGVGKVLLILFLLLLLVLAAAVGYPYYCLFHAPFVPDDPQALAAAAPMEAGERFRVSAQDHSIQLRLDKRDIWSLLLSYAGNDFLDLINEETSEYGISVSGCAIHMDRKDMWLDLEVHRNGKRLTAGILLDLQFRGWEMILKPAGLKVGLFKIPVEFLPDELKLEQEVVLPVLTEVTQVGYEKDAILLTGDPEPDVRSLMPSGDILERALIFCKDYQSLTDALFDPAGFSGILPHLEEHPEEMQELYRGLFTLAEPQVTEDYLEERGDLTQRFFPGIDFSALAREQEILDEQLRVQYITLKKFFTNAVNEYNPNRLRIIDGVFIYEEEPFRADLFEYRKYGTVFEVLDPEAAFLMVVDAEDGFIRKTPAFGELVDKAQAFTREVDFEKPYILGLVLRSVDGDPYVMYETELTVDGLYVREPKLRLLTEDAVKALQVPGKIGVWTDKE